MSPPLPEPPGTSAPSPASEPAVRARDLGLGAAWGPTGPANAITDVAGVRVGHTTLITDAGPVRTGVTVVLPRPHRVFDDPVFAGCHRLNGNGMLPVDHAADVTPVAVVRMLPNARISPLFVAAVDATEEAVLNALLAARTMSGRGGATAHALTTDLLRRALAGGD